MSDSLTSRQEEVVSHLPNDAAELRDRLGYGSKSPVYDMMGRIDGKDGYQVEIDEDGEYYLAEAPSAGESVVDTNRTPSTTKQSITRQGTDTLAELERRLISRLAETEPARSEIRYTQSGEDMVLPRADDHFGQVETNQYGEEIFNTDIAEDRVWQYVDRALSVKQFRESAGTTFDSAKLLLLGDHITNENIYAGQPHEIDETLLGQLERVSDIYTEVIAVLADEFPEVTVVTQHGNHGELRTGGQSNEMNADDIFYSMLDLAVRQSELENVTFIQNDATNYTEFPIRNGRHRGHIRHGNEQRLGHIGTSAGQQRWGAWLQQSADRGDDPHGFDVAYWGHFHELKLEPINGRPVIMAGTAQPAGDYEDSLGIPTGEPAALIHGATDEQPVAWTEFVRYE